MFVVYRQPCGQSELMNCKSKTKNWINKLKEKGAIKSLLGEQVIPKVLTKILILLLMNPGVAVYL